MIGFFPPFLVAWKLDFSFPSLSYYDYSLRQQVLKKVHNPTKLGVRTMDPYTIDGIHLNSNLTIILPEGVTECINICRVLLYQ